MKKPFFLSCIFAFALFPGISEAASLMLVNNHKVEIEKNGEEQSMEGRIEVSASLWTDLRAEEKELAKTFVYLVFEDDFIHVYSLACWDGRLSAFSNFSSNSMRVGNFRSSSTLATGQVAKTLFPRAARHLALRNAEPCSPAFVRHHEDIELHTRPSEGSESDYFYKIKKKTTGMFNKKTRWIIDFEYNY